MILHLFPQSLSCFVVFGSRPRQSNTVERTLGHRHPSMDSSHLVFKEHLHFDLLHVKPSVSAILHDLHLGDSLALGLVIHELMSKHTGHALGTEHFTILVSQDVVFPRGRGPQYLRTMITLLGKPWEIGRASCRERV